MDGDRPEKSSQDESIPITSTSSAGDVQIQNLPADKESSSCTAEIETTAPPAVKTEDELEVVSKNESHPDPEPMVGDGKRPSLTTSVDTDPLSAPAPVQEEEVEDFTIYHCVSYLGAATIKVRHLAFCEQGRHFPCHSFTKIVIPNSRAL